MNSKSTVKIDSRGPSPADDTASAMDGSSRSTDNWLKRELESLYSEIEVMPLPANLAALAAELEGKLQSVKLKNKEKPESN